MAPQSLTLLDRHGERRRGKEVHLLFDCTHQLEDQWAVSI